MTDDGDRGTDSPPRPPRPATGHWTPPPDLAPLRPTRVIRVLRLLWVASFVAAATTVTVAFLARERIGTELSEFLAELAPDRAEETLESVSMIVLTAGLVAIGVVALIEVLLLRGLLRKHGVFRWLLFGALLLQVGVSVLADAFIALGPYGLYLRALLIAGLVLAAAGAVTGATPAVGDWVRGLSVAPRHTR